MPRKLKFKPEIRRIKLNPEQAVLTCNCHHAGVKLVTGVRESGMDWLGFPPDDLYCRAGGSRLRGQLVLSPGGWKDLEIAISQS